MFVAQCRFILDGPMCRWSDCMVHRVTAVLQMWLCYAMQVESHALNITIRCEGKLRANLQAWTAALSSCLSVVSWTLATAPADLDPARTQQVYVTRTQWTTVVSEISEIHKEQNKMSPASSSLTWSWI